jgi:hypothetical protein
VSKLNLHCHQPYIVSNISISLLSSDHVQPPLHSSLEPSWAEVRCREHHLSQPASHQVCQRVRPPNIAISRHNSAACSSSSTVFRHNFGSCRALSRLICQSPLISRQHSANHGPLFHPKSSSFPWGSTRNFPTASQSNAMLTENSYHAAHNRSCASPLRSENYPSPERITAASRLSGLWGLQRQFHATTLTVYACRWPATISEICRSDVLDAVVVELTFQVVRSLMMKQGLQHTAFLLMASKSSLFRRLCTRDA